MDRPHARGETDGARRVESLPRQHKFFRGETISLISVEGAWMMEHTSEELLTGD